MVFAPGVKIIVFTDINESTIYICDHLFSRFLVFSFLGLLCLVSFPVFSSYIFIGLHGYYRPTPVPHYPSCYSVIPLCFSL